MTANKDLKKLIRSRMRKTGESYTSARRYFLSSGRGTMHDREQEQQTGSQQQLPIESLQLTLRTTRILQSQGLLSIGQLAGKTDSDLADIGLERQAVIEVREVLASRGL